jgi:hypothetical protein
LIVAGRTIVKDGAVLGVDVATARAEVLGRIRHAMANKAAIVEALPLLECAVAKYFEPSPGCF